MRFRTMAAAMLAIVAAGCTLDQPTNPDVVLGGDLASGSTCTWSPQPYAIIGSGQSQLFTAQPGCIGYPVSLSPSNGDFGFDATCSSQTGTTSLSGKFTVKNCGVEEDEATVTIDLGGGMAQQITINHF